MISALGGIGGRPGLSTITSVKSYSRQAVFGASFAVVLLVIGVILTRRAFSDEDQDPLNFAGPFLIVLSLLPAAVAIKRFLMCYKKYKAGDNRVQAPKEHSTVTRMVVNEDPSAVTVTIDTLDEEPEQILGNHPRCAPPSYSEVIQSSGSPSSMPRQASPSELNNEPPPPYNDDTTKSQLTFVKPLQDSLNDVSQEQEEDQPEETNSSFQNPKELYLFYV